MTLINRYSVKIFFTYNLFCIYFLLLFPQSNYFVILRNFGILLFMVIAGFLAYIFTISKNNDEKFQVLKKISAIIFLSIILNFSKIIAGVLFDEIELVLSVLFNDQELTQKIVQNLY